MTQTQIARSAAGCNENRAVTYVEVTATVFAYGGLPPDVAQALRHQAARIRERSRTVAAAVIEIGRDLRAVQQQLKDRRQFCDWVTAECGFSLSSAYNYIDASKLADKFPTVGNLYPRTLYALARKSTPLEIVDQVINCSSNGDVVPFVDVKRMLDTAREHKREADRKEKEAARRRRLTKKGREKEDARRVERESERARAEEAAKANARSITERFGSEGVTFLLSIRWELSSALDVLDYERTHEGKAASP